MPCLLCGAPGGRIFAKSTAQLASERPEFRFLECEKCQLIRLNPRVRADAVGSWYDSSYLPHRGASAWGRHATFVERAERAQDRARVRRLCSEVRLTRQARVLDFGCGRPTFLHALHQATGARSVGLDFSDHGWRDQPARWRALELHHGRLDTFETAPEFDAVTLWHALEHDYDPVSTLRQLRRLTRAGGILIVEVPNADSWTRRLHRGHWAGFHTPRHTTVFTPRTLSALLTRAGWRVRRLLPWGTLDPYVLWWLGRQDMRRTDLNGDLSPHFASFLVGRILATPILALQRWISLGVQTAVAVRD